MIGLGINQQSSRISLGVITLTIFGFPSVIFGSILTLMASQLVDPGALSSVRDRLIPMAWVLNYINHLLSTLSISKPPLPQHIP